MERAAENKAEQKDLQLFEAAQKGDFEAFEEIVRRYHDKVYRLAFGMTQNQTDAEEVMQDAFLKIFRGLSTFRGHSSPASWIYSVAANSALMRLRQRRRRPTLSIEDLPPTVVGNGGKRPVWEPGEWTRQPDDRLLTQELGDYLWRAIAELPEKYRLVLLLRDVEGLSNNEVALTLGLTLPTVKARLHRSRLYVRETLERYFEHNGNKQD